MSISSARAPKATSIASPRPAGSPRGGNPEPPKDSGPRDAGPNCGGHGGILVPVSHAGAVALTYLPAYRHTASSQVNLSRMPNSVAAVRLAEGKFERFEIAIKDDKGQLLESAIPSVAIVKDGGHAA